MKPTTLLWCAAVVAACANVASPTSAASARLAEAERLLTNDPHAALAITDELLKDSPNWRDARMCAARGSRLLAQSGGSHPDLLLMDAKRNLEVMLEDAAPATEAEAWLMLAECRRDLGEFENGATAALKAAEGFAAKRNKEGNRKAAAAVLLAGKCQMHTFAAARQLELDTGEKDQRGIVRPSQDTAKLAGNLITRFESVRNEFPGEACSEIARICQFLGQPSVAVAEFERSLRAMPTEQSLHTAYIDWMIQMGQQEAMVGAYSGFVRENPSVPLLHWFAGRSLYARADQLRSLGNFQGAITAYGKAQSAYGEYAAMEPGHADSAKQWIALCELSISRTSIELGDYAGAQQHLFAAEEASPLAVAYEDGRPQLADSFGSHYTGVVYALNRALAESGVDGVEKALAFNEAVLQRHPDRWGFLYNNAALPARDLGVRFAEAGKQKEAMELWERSYRYYEKAVALSPDDARIVNDCGLMLIYHLNRDLDHARELFERAIAIGQKQLDAMPEDVDRSEKELLEEAVGDAYQNIAMLLRNHQHAPFAEYEPFCTRSVRYYPYERRSAAALLRSKGADDGDSPAPGAAQQGNAAEVLDKATPKVKAKVDEGDLDAALTVLDDIAKDCKEYAPYHALRGDITLQLARKSRDEGRKGVEFFFQDAVAALKKAVSLDGEPIAPRLMLCQAMFDANDLEGAATTATALLLHMQSKGGGKAADLLAVHTVRANAAARAYATQKGEGKDNQELLTSARTSFRALEQQEMLSNNTRALWSTTEQWAGAAAEAVNIYARAVAKNPEDQAMLGALVDTAAAQNQLPLAQQALQDRTDATGLWYLGRVRFLLAGSDREAGKNAEALKALDMAQQAFAQSMQKNASYRDSCEQWIAMCLGKKGNIAFRSDDLANAEKWLLESAQSRPDRIGDDLGLNETTKLGILLLADKFYKQRNLGKVEAIYRAASDAANGDLDLLNNSGLFARDWGNQLESQGKTKEAMGMYEQSYKAYRRAQQLDPANVRLRNDCALIAIYHLERDWDMAKELLDSAIADGKKMLADNPPADRDEQQKLDEAVGDCYENLALWHLKHSKDYAAAKAAAQSSLEHHPGARRGGARKHLQDAERLLQGK
jgi:hypothetical protein